MCKIINLKKFKNNYFLYYFNIMENKNIFIGKLQKNGCYVNNDKYGYFLTCDKKNYKIPEWFPAEKMDLEIAERLIAFKNKMSEQYLVTKEMLDQKAAKDEAQQKTERSPIQRKGEGIDERI